MTERYTATVKARAGYAHLGDYPTREEAARAAFDRFPNIKECSTGFGYHGCMDIRWHRREDFDATKLPETL